MNAFPQTSLKLPVKQSIKWNKTHDILSLKSFNTKNKLNHSTFVHLYNLSGDYIGLGFFCIERADELVFLESSQISPYDFIKKQITLALNKKADFIQNYKSYRLIHHSLDGLPGLVIENYEGNIFLKSYNSLWDQCTDTLKQILKELLPISLIYIKNFFNKRHKAGLKLYDTLYFGSLFSDTISIHENHFEYLYDTHNTDLFSLINRPTRYWLNSFLSSTAKQSTTQILIIGNLKTEELISRENNNKLLEINILDNKNKSFTQICESLRDMQKSSLSYDIVCLDHTFLKNTATITKSLFHLYYNLYKLIHDQTLLIVQTYNKNLILRTLKDLNKKISKKLKIIDAKGQDLDFGEKTLEKTVKHMKYNDFFKIRIE